MAKKKQKKEKEKFEYSNEIIGVLLILLSIIGMLGYGRAGNFIRSFSVFLVGIAYFPLLVAFLALGVYLIVKRKSPKMVSRTSIGIYLIAVAILTILHLEYVKKQPSSELIMETFRNVMLAFKSSQVIKNCGGGMAGAILAYVFNWAFSSDGIIIVVITLIILGIILIFNTSILSVFKKIKLPKLTEQNDNEENETSGKEDNTQLEDKRVVISSIEELTGKKEEIAEEVDADIPIKKPGDDNKGNEIPTDVDSQETVHKNTNYKLPSLNLLKTVKNVNSRENEQVAKENISKLEEVLKVFEISGKIVQVNIGPTVTQYELDLKAGTKVNKLLGIQREIALAMASPRPEPPLSEERALSTR